MNLLRLLGLGRAKPRKQLIGELYYNLDSKTKKACVTSMESNSIHDNYDFTGEFVIPSEVTFNGAEYTVTTIGTAAFFECRTLNSIIIPDTVTNIEERAFENCIALTSVTLPKGLTVIKPWVFAWCKVLASITLPDSLTTIGKYAFSNCLNLNSIVIPEHVTAIRLCAFYNCWNFIDIIIPDSVAVIEYAAFYEDQSLRSITLGKGVTEIGRGVFACCKSLTTFNVDPDNPKFSSDGIALYNKDKTLFWKLACAVTSVVIPNTVTRIYFGALFNSMNMDSVTIPSSVTEIMDLAFHNVFIKDLYVSWTTPLQMSANMFTHTTIHTLHVPAGTKELYAVADGWKIAKEIVEDAPTG